MGEAKGENGSEEMEDGRKGEREWRLRGGST